MVTYCHVCKQKAWCEIVVWIDQQKKTRMLLVCVPCKEKYDL